MRTDYEQLAGRYDEDREMWPIPRDDVVAELVTVGSTARVLDLGCGTGRWLAAQREHFGAGPVEWLGLDPSPGMLAQASAKGIERLVRGRAEDLPVGDASLDYIVCSYAFHHFVDKERALDEVGRALAARGVFAITNLEPAAADGWWLYEFFPETIAIDAARFWRADRIAEALDARGFAVDVDFDGGFREIPAADALREAERRVVSQLALLDDDCYERGLAGLRGVAGDDGATVTTTRSRLRLTARRP